MRKARHRAHVGAAGSRSRLGYRLPARPFQLRGDPQCLHAAFRVQGGCGGSAALRTRARGDDVRALLRSGSTTHRRPQSLHALCRPRLGDPGRRDGRCPNGRDLPGAVRGGVRQVVLAHRGRPRYRDHRVGRARQHAAGRPRACPGAWRTAPAEAECDARGVRRNRAQARESRCLSKIRTRRRTACSGPCIIVEDETTIIVPSNAAATCRSDGCIEIFKRRGETAASRKAEAIEA